MATTDRAEACAGSRRRPRLPSIALVEVAATQEIRDAEVLLDPEMELQEVLRDLRRGVALRAGVVGEGEHHQVGVRSCDGLQPSRVAWLDPGICGHEADEPRVEGQPTLSIASPKFRRARL